MQFSGRFEALKDCFQLLETKQTNKPWSQWPPHFTIFRIICRKFFLSQMFFACIHDSRCSVLLTGWSCSTSVLSRICVLAEKSREDYFYHVCSWSPSLLKKKTISWSFGNFAGDNFLAGMWDLTDWFVWEKFLKVALPCNSSLEALLTFIWFIFKSCFPTDLSWHSNILNHLFPSSFSLIPLCSLSFVISDSFLRFPWVHILLMQPTFFLTLLSILAELILFSF